MRTTGLVLLAVVCGLSSAWPVVAQEQAGSIAGVVRDSSGAVLPGAIVEAHSPRMAGTSRTVSDAEGAYRFPALPAGTYTVTASRPGFSARTIADVALDLGRLLKVDLTLSVAGVAETVQVRGAPPVLDTRQNAGLYTVGDEIIQRIPKGRDFTSLLKIAPGAEDEAFSGGIQVDGASGAENRFIIDGLDTTDLLKGTSGKNMLVDFVTEVQVKSSGYNAEFGGATGGVISAVTKSGSNTLTGGTNLHFSDSQMRGARRPSSRYWPWDSSVPERGLLYPDVPWSYLSVTADAGGPIRRDRLWYYAGYGLTSTSYAETAIFYRDPARNKWYFDWWNRSHIVNYNITARVTDNIRVRFGGANERSGNRERAPSLEPDNSTFRDGTSTQGYTNATYLTTADGNLDRTDFENRWYRQGSDGSNDTLSANLDWVIGPRLAANVVAGYFRANSWTPPEFRGDEIQHFFNESNAGLAGVPEEFQHPDGYEDNPSTYGTPRDIFSRIYVNANATFFKSFVGQHTLKAGVRFERLGNDVLSGSTRPEISLTWGQPYLASDGRVVEGTYGYYSVSQPAYVGEVHSNNVSLWFQDSWTIRDRLTINGGVRVEREHIPSYKKTPDAAEIQFGFGQKVAPRLGFAWDVKGDSKWKVYASFGWFFDITKLELARSSFGSDHWMEYYWTLDTYDWPSIQ